jgi:hypothetical protein
MAEFVWLKLIARMDAGDDDIIISISGCLNLLKRVERVFIVARRRNAENLRIIYGEGRRRVDDGPGACTDDLSYTVA